MQRRIAAAVAWLTAASACGGSSPDPRLLLVRKVEERTRLFLTAPRDGAEPREVLEDLPGDLHSPRAIDGGRAFLVMARRPGASRSTLWRVRAAARLEKERQLADEVPGRIVAASADGSMILLTDGTTVYALRDGGGAVEVTTFRYFAGGDVSPDGTRAVIAGTPRECAERPLHECPIDLFAVELGAGPPALRPLVVARRANYLPVFVPGTSGAEVAYQTTADDDSPTCAANLNDCRHDLMRIAWDGGEPRRFRRAALGQTFSPDGRRVAYLSNEEDETGCRSVVCDTMSVYVLDTAGTQGAVRLVTANASNLPRGSFSPDGRWLTYTGRDRKTLELVGADGQARRSVGEVLERAWIR